MNRREFLKYTGGGLTALVVGGGMPWLFENEAYAAVRVQELNFTITDAMKEMVTFNTLPTNIPAKCYFWIYKEATLPADCPGPNIFCTEGDIIKITIKNDLDEPHAFFIPGIFNSGPIPPGATRIFRFRARRTGTHLYYDNLNAPVNRVMGLHGAFVVMPKRPLLGHKFTPYSRPTKAVQKLFDDFGSTPHWPGLSWEQGDPATDTPPFRQYIWLCHDASPLLFAEVGNHPAGLNYPAADFVKKFTEDPLNIANPVAEANFRPQYFTISGQSGHFSHNNPFINPNNRVGEPTVVRILHAGLQTHSLHIHANHVFVTCINGKVQANPLWLDVFTLHPLDGFEYVLPYMRPPDVPNVSGIGPTRTVVNVPGTGLVPADTLLVSDNGHPVWPPVEELATFIPAPGTTAGGAIGGVDISMQLSPLCYPMHDHSEPTQTAQGGNYNMGMIAGMNFTGDRNTPGGVTTFPNNPTVHGPSATGTPAGPEV